MTEIKTSGESLPSNSMGHTHWSRNTRSEFLTIVVNSFIRGVLMFHRDRFYQPIGAEHEPTTTHVTTHCDIVFTAGRQLKIDPGTTPGQSHVQLPLNAA